VLNLLPVCGIVHCSAEIRTYARFLRCEDGRMMLFECIASAPLAGGPLQKVRMIVASPHSPAVGLTITVLGPWISNLWSCDFLRSLIPFLSAFWRFAAG